MDDDGILLSKRDHDELQRLLRDYRDGRLTRPRQLRRRIAGGGGVTIHKAYCKEDAPASDYITCTIGQYSESEEDEVEVYCRIAGTQSLNNAIPRLEDGDMIFVVHDGTEWVALMMFQSTIDCS